MAQSTLLPAIDMIGAKAHALGAQVAELQADAARAGMVISAVRTDLDDCLRILASNRQQPELFGPGGVA